MHYHVFNIQMSALYARSVLFLLYSSLLPTNFYTSDLHKFPTYPSSVLPFTLVQAVRYSQLISLE